MLAFGAASGSIFVPREKLPQPPFVVEENKRKEISKNKGKRKNTLIRMKAFSWTR
ncbi:Hypothetical protein, putative [Bodo saltans]|uniref:Uncharacterized protein n=1 Tax=Bodo saltans TaxID=75058 RepID=A0A0S4JS10_BODSA|nr:Hypothetical protein, putative [Bodo saltans]|eukprot:CUG93370.1 Hypothetical protein, putative [Bodo saltans]